MFQMFSCIIWSFKSDISLASSIAVWFFSLWRLHFSLHGGLFSLLMVSSVHCMSTSALTFLVSHNFSMVGLWHGCSSVVLLDGNGLVLVVFLFNISFCWFTLTTIGEHHLESKNLDVFLKSSRRRAT